MQGLGSAVKNWRALPLGGYPAIFGKNAGARQCSKKLASATAGGLPLIFGKNAGARQCSKNWRALPLGGYPSIFGKNAGAGQCSKKLERAFGKVQGQGSAVKDWRALLGGYPTIFGKMQGQGSAAKIGERCWGGYPSILQEQGSAAKIWRALPLGRDPCIFRKNMGALIPTKTPYAKPLSALPIINHLGSGIPCTSSRLCFPLPLPRPTE